MALIKSAVIEMIRERTGSTWGKSMELVESLLEIMKATLEQGEGILISGFGSFQIIEKAPRRGRNPQTGEAMMLPAKRVVTFRVSRVLKRRLSGADS